MKKQNSAEIKKIRKTKRNELCVGDKHIAAVY